VSLNHCCARAVFVACESQEAEIRKLRAADEVTKAELARAKADNRALLALITKQGGYLTAEAQDLLRGVRARLGEHGGKP